MGRRGIAYQKSWGEVCSEWKMILKNNFILKMMQQKQSSFPWIDYDIPVDVLMLLMKLLILMERIDKEKVEWWIYITLYRSYKLCHREIFTYGINVQTKPGVGD